MGQQKNITRNVYNVHNINSMNSTLHGETGQHYEKRVFWVFLTLFRYQNAKMHTMPPIEENKTTFHEPCLLNVFELITYQNTKTDAKHSLWRNIITLPKTCIFSVFQHFYVQKRQNAKYPEWGNEKTLQETFIMSVFELLRNRNAKMYELHIIWRKTAFYQ